MNKLKKYKWLILTGLVIAILLAIPGLAEAKFNKNEFTKFAIKIRLEKINNYR